MTDKEKNEIKETGYEFTKGACTYLSKIIIYSFVIAIIFNMLRQHFEWGMDDSDLNGWKRSGLRVHTDHKTGIQYLSDGNGGLIERSK